MSGGPSDIAQDEELEKTYRELKEKTSKFIKPKLRSPQNPKNREAALELMREWTGYSNMRFGYFEGPNASVANRSILMLGKWIEGEIKYDSLKEFLTKKSQDVHHNYFAVGGHGNLMNPLDGIIESALEKKFGEVVHSFDMTVLSDGKIDFRKLSCAACPKVRNCSMSDCCNCYNNGEYRQVQKDKERDKSALSLIAKKYGLKLRV